MARNRMISLEYEFIFERQASVWSNLSEFENDLSDFLKSQGLQAEIIVPINGNGGKGAMFIRKLDEQGKLTNPKGPELTKGPPPGPRALEPSPNQKSATTARALLKKLTRPARPTKPTKKKKWT